MQQYQESTNIPKRLFQQQPHEKIVDFTVLCDGEDCIFGAFGYSRRCAARSNAARMGEAESGNLSMVRTQRT